MKNQNLELESISSSFRSDSTNYSLIKKNGNLSHSLISESSIGIPQNLPKFRTLHCEEDVRESKLKDKRKFNKSAIYRLLQYTKKEMKLLILGQIFLLINAGSQVSIPYLSGQFLDVVAKEGSNSSDELRDKALAFMAAAILLVISNFVKFFCDCVIAERVSISMKTSLFRSLINNDVSFYDNKKTGELLSRLGSDIATVKWAASNNFSMAVRNIVVCFGSFILLFTISRELTLYIALVIPMFAGFSMFFGRYNKKLSKTYQDTIADGSIIAEEAFGNIRVVKSFSTEEKESEQFDSIMKAAYKIGFKKSFIEALLFSFIMLIINAAILIVLWYGGILVIHSQMTSGQLASFIFYALFLAGSSSAVASAMNQLVTASGVCERLFELMDYEPLINNRGGLTDMRNLKGKVEFKDVSFSYPNKQEVYVLKNLNLCIQAGEVVALVGSSGGGKTTIANLIERFYDPKSGEILIDGIDSRKYDIKALHQRIGHVPQEPSLFSGTIEENITYGLDTYTQEMLDNATKLANCYDFIHDKNAFPKGYQTFVGERGMKLSGGQKQRVAIARALIKEPKILVLDEATSALDAENEFQVQKAIEVLMHKEDLTMIVIAHRLSTIINCKRIIVISEGRIAEEGRHEELIEKSGVYKNLVEKQMRGYII